MRPTRRSGDEKEETQLQQEEKQEEKKVQKLHPCSRLPPDPRDPDFWQKLVHDARELIRATQEHKCTGTCKKARGKRSKDCRFDYPKELVPETVVTPAGDHNENP